MFIRIKVKYRVTIYR